MTSVTSASELPRTTEQPTEGSKGRILVVDMLPHDREDMAGRMGHVWLGFAEESITSHLDEAGFHSPRIVPLPADPDAQGPALFAAAARRAA